MVKDHHSLLVKDHHSLLVKDHHSLLVKDHYLPPPPSTYNSPQGTDGERGVQGPAGGPGKEGIVVSTVLAILYFLCLRYGVGWGGVGWGGVGLPWVPLSLQR